MPQTASPPTLDVGYGTNRTELPHRDYTDKDYAAAQRAVEAAIGIGPSGEATVIIADGRRVQPGDPIGPQVRKVEFLPPVDPLG